MRTRLFIGDMEADLTGSPDILFNFQTDDVTSPSAVKNSYSKTVTLVGSKQNNRIFDEYWLNEHVTKDGTFDPSKKTPFKIYVDSELAQEGYCKLDKVTTKDNLPEWSLTLYGGLGEFLYSLSQTDGGDKKTLADLNWYITPEDITPTRLDFVINQDTVKEAWDEIESYTSKWSVLNFAPALQGIPENFSADKCLMVAPVDTDGPIGALSYTEDGRTYRPYSTGRYILAEMSRDRTADEMREFRSYLMRPVLSVRKTIENICRPENNGGWKVNLDPEFFKYDNPWWARAYVTLPNLTSLSYNAQETASAVTMSLGTATTGKTTTGWWSDDDTYYEVRPVSLNGMEGERVYNVKASITLKANIPGESRDVPVYPSARYGRRTSQRTSHVYYNGSVFVQLVAYDAGGNAIAGSKLMNLTGRNAYTPEDFKLQYPYGDTTYDTFTTGFLKESTGVYAWGDTLTLSLNKVPRGTTVKLWVIKANHGNGSADALLSDEDKGLWAYTQETGNMYRPLNMSDFTVVVNSYDVTAERNESMRSNTVVTQEELLDTSYSPADFLLNYGKMFGLFFVKNPVKKEISILSRKSFFKRDEIVDIEDRLDRTQTEITPLVAKARWYRWDQAPSGEYADEYKKTYGKDYGEYDYATSYDFDSNTEEVLKNDKTFKGAVQVLERGTDFWYTGDDTWKPWMYDGYSYVLYDTSAPSETHEVEVPMSTSVDVATHVQGREYYDLFDKVQLHGANNNASGGEGVLLFFDRMVDLKAGTQQLKYFITDDNAKMAILNDGEPCWFWTNGEYDFDNVKVATRVYECPKFSRYLITDAGNIQNSWDFGQPAETYIPGTTYREDSTIFNVFWESYIRDLYDRDTRRLKGKMLLEDKVTVDWLRRFYLFSNSIWRMDKITNADITDRKLTDVEFVKVQDVASYDNRVPSEYGTITVTFNPATVPSTGGTVQFTVDVSDGGAWELYAPYDSDLVWSATAGTGTYTGTVQVPQNSSTSAREITVIAYAYPNSTRVYLRQEGETAQLNYIGTSPTGGTSSDVISASGGTAYFELVATTGWTLGASGFQSVTPSAGTATTGTVIEAVAGANQYPTSREMYMTGTLSTGAYFRSGTVRQEAGGVTPASLTVQPTQATVGAYGGTLEITVISTLPWQLNYTYEWLTSVSPVSGTAGETIVTVVAPANDGGERFSDIRFSFQDAPATVVAHCNLTQQERQTIYNKMWYKSSVKVTPNGGTAKITDTSGRTCTVSDSVMISSGEYAPHWEFEFSTAYIPEALSGATFSGNTNLTGFRWYGSESGETAIMANAFADCVNLESVEIYGNGAGGFGGSVFSGCTSLKSAVINFANTGSTMFSGDYAFYGYLFYNCTALESADISMPYNYLPANAVPFSGCTNLQTITIRKCGTQGTFTLRNRIALSLGALTTVNLVNITNLSYNNTNTRAFQNCQNLTDVYWEGTVQTAQTSFSTSRVSGCPSFTVHCSDGEYQVPSTL